MKTEFFTVPQVGIGRKDYSEGIEFATQASFRGHQARITWTADFIGVPTVPFPFAYAMSLDFFDASGVLVPVAPDIPYHIYKVALTSERACLVVAGFYRFASWDDFLLGIVEKWYGDIYGYNDSEIIYTHGIKTVPGRAYAVALAEYSEQPDFAIHMTVDALKEEIIYG